MKVLEYLEITERLGFKQILKVDFKGDKGRDEAFYVFWDTKRSILLCFDTYGINVNVGNFYYNWIPKDRQVVYKYTSSGGFEKHNDGFVWVGYHNCSEDLEKTIENFEENGDFVVQWIKQPFLWLVHYGDDKRKEYKDINKQRIAMLPEGIQTAIRGIENEN